MKVSCSSCKTEYTITDEKIADKKILARCRKCGETFAINPQSKSREELIVSLDLSREPEPAVQEGEFEDKGLAANLPLFAAYPELLSLSCEKFDFLEIFSPDKKGNYKNRKNTFKVKILKAISATVVKIQNDDEKVIRVAKGTAYYPSELFFGNGYLTMMYNHYALVCTDTRLIFININTKITSVTNYFFQLPYNEIKNVKRGMLFGRLICNKKKGKRRLFNSVKRSLLREIEEFVSKKIVTASPASQTDDLLENLCPSCFTPLQKGRASCPACSAVFKSPQKAALRSLILPGLGDIYLGHKLLGTFELVGSLIVWLVVISIIASGGKETVIIGLIMLFFVNGFDGIMTYSMGQKGYLLE